MMTPKSNPGLGSATDLDALDRSRRLMLIAVVAASTMWILPEILRGIFSHRLPHSLRIALVIAGIIGALAFVVFMLRYNRFQMRVLADPDLRQRLDDERVLELRKESVYRGWLVLMIAIAIGVVVAPFVELPDQVVLLTLMFLAGNAPIVFFLALDRS